MKTGFRIEKDSMGDMRVASSACYAAQTARAVNNFPISNLRFPRSFIRALGLIKKSAAAANQSLGALKPRISQAIQSAAEEVADGKLDAEFVVDIFQTGSGTSTNMNANEVIANRAAEILGGKRGDRKVHPNDHVNRGQSSNDVIPTAIHVSALDAITHNLLPALKKLQDELGRKAKEFAEVLKIGRTHLQDATPMRLGQEFSGYASQVGFAVARIREVSKGLAELALGGTAVGTGLNTHPEFARRTIERLSRETRLPLREAKNHFQAQGSIDACVAVSSALKAAAVALIKIANDIRWLGSGPRCGLGELKLPATQPGSSIMPGKVNPVMCEMLIQVGAQVIGCDAVVTFSGAYGAFELNTMLPVAAYNLLLSIDILSNASNVFTRRCVKGIEADEEKCRSNIEQSLAMCTALAPAIGYDKAAEIARRAYKEGRTVRDVAYEVPGLDRKKVDEALNAAKQSGGMPRGGS
jgi:fumarate hydratase class II